MIKRFEGVEGQRLLLDSLKNQLLINGNEDIANSFMGNLVLRELGVGDEIISQDGEDNSLFFILAGSLEILVNARAIGTREANTHVGEMALIDGKAKRSATVRAIEKSVVAEISEPEFSKIANQNPDLWRRISFELCDRLRARNRFIRQPNSRPRLFIGSSAEAIWIAEAIQSGLSHHNVVATIWTNQIFGASKFTLEDLETQVTTSDFAVMVFTDDDSVVSRRKKSDAPRDNVIFELGLFMGRLWRERKVIVQPRGIDLKVPSDLLGLGCLEFRLPDDRNDIAAEIGPVVTELKKIIEENGPF